VARRGKRLERLVQHPTILVRFRRIAEAVRRGVAILLPQQHQRHARPAQLAMHDGPIRLWALISGQIGWRRIEPIAGHRHPALVATASSGREADVEAARSALTHAQDRLNQQKTELRRIEVDAPLPTQAEGQLNIARSELLVIEAAVEKMTIRAPITSIVLQMNANC
jgi:multidrug resistance efflux pump